MPSIRRRLGPLGWVGVALCAVAVVAILIPAVGYVRASRGEGVRFDGTTQRAVLPADRTYGVYIDDADNSGYSESCSAVDADGGQVEMSDAWWSVSSSDTETLDYVFNTGSGTLTFTCVVPGEQVTVKPVPNLRALVIGVVLAGVIGCAGVCMLLAWFIRPPHTTIPQPDSADDAPLSVDR